MQEKDSKLYYSIKEVAAMFNVNESLLRYWEKKFGIIKPRKNAKNTRFYKKEDIEAVKMVYYLVKERGMTLDGAAKIIERNKKDVSARIKITEKLNNIKQELLEIRKSLSVLAPDEGDAPLF